MSVEPFLLERFFAEYEFTTPHLLAVSDCESMTVGDLLDLEPGARETLEATWLGYTESEGGLPLRQALAGQYPSLGPDHFLVHGAGVEVLLTVALAVLKPGDHAVVQAPCYQAARTAPGMAGADVSLWTGRPDAGWAPQLEELEGLFNDRTRLLVINTPHNPTGYHFSRDDLEWILTTARDRGIQVLVDEAYRWAEYDDARRLPSAAELCPQAGALGLLSKGHGLPGLRTAWLATRNDDLRDAVARAKDYTTICAPAPSELLSAVALRNAPVIIERNRAILRENLALLTDFMERHAQRFEFIPPQAGSVCMPLLREGDPADFLARAREEAGVLLAPGSILDAPPAAFRMGFGRRAFATGLARLEEWLQA